MSGEILSVTVKVNDVEVQPDHNGQFPVAIGDHVETIVVVKDANCFNTPRNPSEACMTAENPYGFTNFGIDCGPDQENEGRLIVEYHGTVAASALVQFTINTGVGVGQPGDCGDACERQTVRFTPTL